MRKKLKKCRKYKDFWGIRRRSERRFEKSLSCPILASKNCIKRRLKSPGNIDFQGFFCIWFYSISQYVVYWFTQVLLKFAYSI